LFDGAAGRLAFRAREEVTALDAVQFAAQPGCCPPPCRRFRGAGSLGLAPLLARRFGLVATMVGTHLPSNVLLAAVAFAPSFAVAAVLLARTTLSQMDVPTRQALVMTVVTADDRTAAAAVTNAARYTVRPLGPLAAGLVQQFALGAPLVLAGAVKAGYDVTLWLWARRRGLTSRMPAAPSGAAPPARWRPLYDIPEEQQ
jgi:hypothetical protein